MIITDVAWCIYADDTVFFELSTLYTSRKKANLNYRAPSPTLEY